jgi:guanylate kinase
MNKSDQTPHSKPILIVISAPSGAGKTTLCSRLLMARSDLKLSISTTTRAPRGQEQEGVDYHFVSPEKFQSLIQEDRFAEWAKVHDYFYGTSKTTIEDAFRDHKHVLLDIDVQGAASLKRLYQEQCFTVFVSPPSLEVLEKRLRSRGTDSDEVVAKRMRNARKEMLAAQSFDKLIINDDLNRAANELLEAVQHRLSK